MTGEALELRRRLHGDVHADTLQSLHNMGVLQVAKGELESAEGSFREALAARLALLGGAHSSVTQTRSALAELCLTQGRFGEAETLLLDAERDTAASGSARTNQQAERVLELVRLYEAWEAQEPARGGFDEAAPSSSSLPEGLPLPGSWSCDLPG
jgi:hypothetical protein